MLSLHKFVRFFHGLEEEAKVVKSVDITNLAVMRQSLKIVDLRSWHWNCWHLRVVLEEGMQNDTDTIV